MNKRTLTLAVLMTTTAVMAQANGTAVWGCTQNEETAATMEFGTELDTVAQQGTLFAKWVYKVPLEDTKRINCQVMYENEVTKQSMELDRMRMEIALLKKQLNSTNVPASGDDW